MIPSVYEKHVHNDPDFPFYFHTAMRSEGRSPALFHWHESIELLYLLEGSCCVVCGQKTVRAAAGDLVVINPGALHAIYQAEEDPAPAVYHCLIIDKSFCDANRIRLSGMWFTERLRSPEAASLMLAIARETAEKREFYKLQVQSLAASLLIRLCREARAVPPPEERDGGGKTRMVKAAMEYMRVHFADPLTIEAVCAAVGFSKYYLCHGFRELTGCTVLDYLNSLRCDYAAQLLASGRYTAAECAEKSGFHTPSYFAKVYRKYRGCPPSAERRRTEGIA